ncbi:hypothetical protein SPSYN_00991 [Sporotomaculum syntrophicum]|uniref:Glyoxalase/fosfomycin resistance/dioxygenase domain-containing protein n=1 Tax=Sporotomaculum syntrophicum TaxID=182264 RepID=A0A9D3AYM8_9FIRM|nr:hypothetical protein SPSYN_00991 [Sporotomaculum syntrophicum]
MSIGAFSISLTVKDINTSKAFYEKLGFTVMVDDKRTQQLCHRND